MRKDLMFLLGIALVGRLALLPILPVQDPDEGRYGQIAKHMVISGDWITPRFWHEGEQVPFLGKPPLQFWMAASCMKILGANKVAARLPGLLAAVGIVVLLFLVLRRYANKEIAVLAAILTVSNGMFFALAGTAIVDMVLAFFVAGALLAYFAFVSEPDLKTRKRWSLLVFALLAGGFMTKGPVAIALFGLPTLAWTAWRKEWGGLKHHAWVRGILLFLALTAPWFWLCEQHNPGFVKYFFLNENLLRYIKHDYGDLYGSGHDYPRGTAVIMMFLAALPWSIWAVSLLWKHRKKGLRSLALSGDSGFFFLGFAVNTAFWCLARQLLMTYMLPLIPLFSVWLAHLVHRRGISIRPIVRFAAGAVVLYIILAAALAPAVFKANGKSTEGVLDRAETIAEQHGIQGPFLFVRRTPYSAYFFARERLLIHPKESVEASIRRGLAYYQPCLLVMSRRYLDRTPEDLRRRFEVVDEYGDWLLFIRATNADSERENQE